MNAILHLFFRYLKAAAKGAPIKLGGEMDCLSISFPIVLHMVDKSRPPFNILSVAKATLPFTTVGICLV